MTKDVVTRPFRVMARAWRSSFSQSTRTRHGVRPNTILAAATKALTTPLAGVPTSATLSRALTSEPRGTSMPEGRPPPRSLSSAITCPVAASSTVPSNLCTSTLIRKRLAIARPC